MKHLRALLCFRQRGLLSDSCHHLDSVVSLLPSLDAKSNLTDILAVSAMFEWMPEELIERILTLVLAPGPHGFIHSAKSNRMSGCPSSSNIRLRLLLISRKIHRIALPLVYARVHLGSRKQAVGFLRSVSRRFILTRFVRDVSLAGVWAEGGHILRMCARSVIGIEFTLDRQPSASAVGGGGSGTQRPRSNSSQTATTTTTMTSHVDDVQVFSRSLRSLTCVHRLTIRKAHNLYITSRRAQYLLEESANAIVNWPSLTHVALLFAVPDDQGSHLVPAIASRPNLRTLITCLPAVWNRSLLYLSEENPSLEKITLFPSSAPRGSLDFSEDLDPRSMLPNSLFLTEAKKHSRLTNLIQHGTFV